MTVEVNTVLRQAKNLRSRSEIGPHWLLERVFHKLLQSEKEALTEENQAHIALNNDNYHFALVGYEVADWSMLRPLCRATNQKQTPLPRPNLGRC